LTVGNFVFVLCDPVDGHLGTQTVFLNIERAQQSKGKYRWSKIRRGVGSRVLP
jgi:hypothetical protein